MTRIARVLAVLLIGAMASGCVALHSRSDATSPPQTVVANYLGALNRRDLLTLTAYVTPDFQWLSMVNGERIVEVDSREALVQMLRLYFERYRDTQWTIEQAQASVNLLAITERFTWREAVGMQLRSTLGVYELQDGRIRRVTYFLNGPSSDNEPIR